MAMLASEFKNELVYEGIICRKEAAKDAKGINSIEVGQVVGLLPMSFYFATAGEPQAMFSACPAEGGRVRIRAAAVVRPKAKGDRVSNHTSWRVLAIEPLGAAGVDVVGADGAMRRRAA